MAVGEGAPLSGDDHIELVSGETPVRRVWLPGYGTGRGMSEPERERLIGAHVEQALAAGKEPAFFLLPGAEEMIASELDLGDTDTPVM